MTEAEFTPDHLRVETSFGLEAGTAWLLDTGSESAQVSGGAGSRTGRVPKQVASAVPGWARVVEWELASNFNPSLFLHL